MPIANLVKMSSFSTLPFSDSPIKQNLYRVEKREKKFNSWAVTGNVPAWQECSETRSVITSNLNEYIAFEFSLVPEITHVFIALRNNNVLYTWIVVDSFDEEVRHKIYNRQEAIIDEFTDFDFDFNVIARMGREMKDLFDSSVQLIHQKDSM